jgi:hypothetical protein
VLGDWHPYRDRQITPTSEFSSLFWFTERSHLLAQPTAAKRTVEEPLADWPRPTGIQTLRDGVVGKDALWNGFLLDFDASLLVLEDNRSPTIQRNSL